MAMGTEFHSTKGEAGKGNVEAEEAEEFAKEFHINSLGSKTQFCMPGSSDICLP